MSEYLGWFLLIVGVVSYACLYAWPVTRPYARKFWWVAVIVLFTGIALVVLRRQPQKPSFDTSKTRDDAKKQQDEALTSIDHIIEHATEQQTAIDVELKARQSSNQVDRQMLQQQLDDAKQIDDSVERRRRLLELAQS